MARKAIQWLNQSLSSFRSSFARQGNGAFTLFNQPLTDAEHRHVYDMMLIELGFVARDAVAIYNIEDPNFNQSMVYPYKYRYIMEHAVSMQDVVMNYFLESSTTYSKIQVADGQYVVIAREPDDDTASTLTLNIENQKHTFTVISSCVVAGVGGAASNRLLYIAFSILAMAYSALSSGTRLSRKVLIEIKGLTATLEKIADKKNAYDDIMSNLVDQGQSMLEDDVAFVDDGTKIALMPIDLTSVEKAINLALDEVSRITKIPKTKLRGTSPVGMNATGEYDDKNYQDTLLALRSTLIEPYLTELGYKFRKQTIVDMDAVMKAMAIKLQMDREDVTISLEGKHRMSVALLSPYLSDGDFIYREGFQDEMINELGYRHADLQGTEEDDHHG